MAQRATLATTTAGPPVWSTSMLNVIFAFDRERWVVLKGRLATLRHATTEAEEIDGTIYEREVDPSPAGRAYARQLAALRDRLLRLKPQDPHRSRTSRMDWSAAMSALDDEITSLERKPRQAAKAQQDDKDYRRQRIAALVPQYEVLCPRGPCGRPKLALEAWLISQLWHHVPDPAHPHEPDKDTLVPVRGYGLSTIQGVLADLRRAAKAAAKG